MINSPTLYAARHSGHKIHKARLAARFMAGLLPLAAALAGASALAQDATQDTVRRAIHVCASCHGEGGQSKTAGTPSLAGQMPQYLMAQLKDFRGQTRAETGSRAYMWGVSALLDDTTIGGLADYYAAQKSAPGHASGASAATVQLGQRLFTQGAPGRGIRACASCHGNQAEGQAGFPRLAGQRADYVVAQLKVFGTQLRPHGVVMKDEVKAMTGAEKRAVAAYLQSL